MWKCFHHVKNVFQCENVLLYEEYIFSMQKGFYYVKVVSLFEKILPYERCFAMQKWLACEIVFSMQMRLAYFFSYMFTM